MFGRPLNIPLQALHFDEVHVEYPTFSPDGTCVFLYQPVSKGAPVSIRCRRLPDGADLIDPSKTQGADYWDFVEGGIVVQWKSGLVCVFSIPSGELVVESPLPNEPVSNAEAGIITSVNRRFLAISRRTKNGLVDLFDLKKRVKVATLENCLIMALSSNGSTIVGMHRSEGEEQYGITDLPTGMKTALPKIPMFRPGNIKVDSKDEYLAVRYVPVDSNGEFLYDDNASKALLVVYRLHSLQELARWTYLSPDGFGPDFSPSGRFLVQSHMGRKRTIIDLDRSPPSPIENDALNSSSVFEFSDYSDHVLTVAKTGAAIHDLSANSISWQYPDKFRSFTFISGGRYFALTKTFESSFHSMNFLKQHLDTRQRDNRRVEVWDVATATKSADVPGQYFGCVSPDGNIWVVDSEPDRQILTLPKPWLFDTRPDCKQVTLKCWPNQVVGTLPPPWWLYLVTAAGVLFIIIDFQRSRRIISIP